MKVDIIVPTYNRPEILLESLDSIRSQTYPRWKCWIAEDGKTQKTFEIIKPFLEDDRFEYMPKKVLLFQMFSEFFHLQRSSISSADTFEI